MKSLPPTQEAFREHVLRAHHQAATWNAALAPDPPIMDPVEYGWTKDEDNHMLQPRTVPADVSLPSRHTYMDVLLLDHVLQEAVQDLRISYTSYSLGPPLSWRPPKINCPSEQLSYMLKYMILR